MSGCFDIMKCLVMLDAGERETCLEIATSERRAEFDTSLIALPLLTLTHLKVFSLSDNYISVFNGFILILA